MPNLISPIAPGGDTNYCWILENMR